MDRGAMYTFFGESFFTIRALLVCNINCVTFFKFPVYHGLFQTVYAMRHSPRGRAVIINNTTFVELRKREGSQYDVETLSRAFKQLDFNVDVWSDLTAVVTIQDGLGQLYHYVTCIIWYTKGH